MDIQKAFEKWAEKHKTGVESKRDEVTAKTAFIAGATWQREQLAKELCKGCYWEENKPLTPVCDLCRVTKSNYTSYEHSIAKTKTEECNG